MITTPLIRSSMPFFYNLDDVWSPSTVALPFSDLFFHPPPPLTYRHHREQVIQGEISTPAVEAARQKAKQKRFDSKRSAFEQQP